MFHKSNALTVGVSLLLFVTTRGVVAAPCSGDPCAFEGHCRSKWGYCGITNEYCNTESTWKPSCSSGDSTAAPVSCAGDPCAMEGHCRSKWGYCGSTSLYCNGESTWMPSCLSGDSTTAPVSCTGNPCAIVGHCRSKWGYCGSTNLYCNAGSTWMPSCSTGSTSGPVSCAGAPCAFEGHCRSKWGYCGSTSEYCNAESTWMPSCGGNPPDGTAPPVATPPPADGTSPPTDTVPVTLPPVGTGPIVCPAGWRIARSTMYDSWPKDHDECVNYEGCKWAGLFSQLNAGWGTNCNAPAELLSGGDPNLPDVRCRFPESVVGQWSIAATYGNNLELLGRKVRVMLDSSAPICNGASSCTYDLNIVDHCGSPLCELAVTVAPILLDLEAQTACRMFGCNYQADGFTVSEAARSTPQYLCFKDVGLADDLGVPPL
jgi:hypothetical protein